MAILGARASERFDADAARAYFQRAIAAARPQERMQIRRMADASLALAERRAGDLKDAVERLGQAPPSGRQMFALRAMGLLVPPASAGILARVRGVLLIILLIIALLAIGSGIVELVSLPFGGIGLAPGVLLGLFVAIAALARHRRDRPAPARPRQGAPAERRPAACSASSRGAGRGSDYACRGVRARLPDRQPSRRRRQAAARGAGAPSGPCARTACTVRRVDTRDLAHARELGRRGGEAGETVVALSGDGLLGALADALREVPGRCSACSPAGAATTSRACSGSPRTPSQPARRSPPGAPGRSISASSTSAAGPTDVRRPSSVSPRRASTATPTASPTRRRRGSAGWSTLYGALRALAAWQAGAL